MKLPDYDYTNGEWIEMLKNLALDLDKSGYNRVLDLVEEITGKRDFEQ